MAYVDDTTFFLKNQKSVIEVLKVFEWFSKQPGLEPNTSKCEIVGIGGLKEVNVALCAMQSIDLKKESLETLAIHFSFNKKLEQ